MPARRAPRTDEAEQYGCAASRPLTDPCRLPSVVPDSRGPRRLPLHMRPRRAHESRRMLGPKENTARSPLCPVPRKPNRTSAAHARAGDFHPECDGSEMRNESWPEADRQDGDPLAYKDVFTAFWPGFIA